MKKHILIALLALGLMGTICSYAQQIPSQRKEKKIEKKDEKMSKKVSIGDDRKATKKKLAAQRKEKKVDMKEEKGK
jgi:hypothetical protein